MKCGGSAGDDEAVSQLTDSVTPPWHALAAEEVTSRLEVGPRVGLSSAEAVRRLERDGPNQLADAPREPRWRLLSAASLEVQESSLTGEAQPVAKSPSAEVDPDAPLGDRVAAVFMNTAVTRGRGEPW